MNIVSENLNLKGVDPLRAEYPKLFKGASGLHGMCAILDHKYEVEGADIIDWDVVWNGLTGNVTKTLKAHLVSAIDAEKAKSSQASSEDKN
jgi:hypothetical protein